MLQLVIGNRNYSSWSLRAGLCIRESKLDFEEIRVPLFKSSDWREKLLGYSPAGRVPVLLDDGFPIWDSLAIMETLAERAGPGWPAEPRMRARARSVCCEMHAGFLALRDELPQNIRTRNPLDPDGLSPDCRAQILRVDQIWIDALAASEGPWLFGEFGIADIMFAPVALRFRTYGVRVSDISQAYIQRIESRESVMEWTELSRQEAESLDFIDELKPAASSPLSLA